MPVLGNENSLEATLLRLAKVGPRGNCSENDELVYKLADHIAPRFAGAQMSLDLTLNQLLQHLETRRFDGEWLILCNQVVSRLKNSGGRNEY